MIVTIIVTINKVEVWRKVWRKYIEIKVRSKYGGRIRVEENEENKEHKVLAQRLIVMVSTGFLLMWKFLNGIKVSKRNFQNHEIQYGRKL